MNLRPALPADSQGIAALHAASWRTAYREALSAAYLAGDIVADRAALWEARLRQPAPNQHVLVAHAGADLLGFACVFTGDDATWGSLLDNLHVGRQAHRRGIGSQLLQAVARHSAAACPQAGLYLWVLAINTGAQRFYEAHGAEMVGTDVWTAPDGSRPPCFRFAWPSGRLPVG